MGHGSDKLYITHREHAGEFGQHGASSAGAKGPKLAASFARLPFDCCALTLKPFETPVCTADGTVYELLSIIPFIRQHGTDPVTGKKLAPGDLIKLNFFKNSEGSYHDPVTFKVFNAHTAIAAVKTSGNVFSRESIDRLNIKPGNWHDLMTDEPFTRKEIITIQDPLNVEARDFSQFDYIKRDLKTDSSDAALAGINLKATGVEKLLKGIAASKTPTTSKSSTAVAGTKVAPLIDTSSSKPATTSQAPPVPYNTSLVSTGRTAASLTSTASALQTTTENALWDEEDLMFEAVSAAGEKAYVRLVTNYGNLNIELFCDRAPRACYNFVQLARQGLYNETIFHRLIPGFMVQGGDPTGSGKGGESFWGKPFADEHQSRNAYKHSDRGILSMANHGPNTQGSQFFITFRSTPHLDGRHTVFGRLVGGDDVLSKIERVPVDGATDRPLKPIKIKDVSVFADPFDVYKKRLEKRLGREEAERAGAGERAKQKAEREKDRTTWFGTTLNQPKATDVEKEAQNAGGIGKYLSIPTKRVADKSDEGTVKRVKVRKGLGDFSSW